MASRLNNLIKRLAAEYDYQWDGSLYRSAPVESKLQAVFYHISPEGAEFYAGSNGSPVVKHQMLVTDRFILIDFDFVGEPTKTKIGFQTVEDWQPENSVDDDPASMVENILPRLRSMGYDVVVINGETGADVDGPSVEVVDISKIQVDIGTIASTLD